MDEILLYAMIGGLALSFITGPLGCFVVWQRMAYFGETVAHGTLLGFVLSQVTQWPLFVCVLAVAASVALVMDQLTHSKKLSSDTGLGIVAHGALAVGIVLISYFGLFNASLHTLLFGDILFIARDQILLLLGCAALFLLVMLWKWRALVAIAVDPAIAASQGVNVRMHRLALVLAIALVVAFSFQWVGVLLFAALLIVPPAAARFVSTNPTGMAVTATALCVCATQTGIQLSFVTDTATGPTIVVVALMLFVVCFAMGAVLQKSRG